MHHWSDFIVFKAPWQPSDSDRKGATENTTEDEMEKSTNAPTQSQRASAPRQGPYLEPDDDDDNDQILREISIYAWRSNVYAPEPVVQRLLERQAIRESSGRYGIMDLEANEDDDTDLRVERFARDVLYGLPIIAVVGTIRGLAITTIYTAIVHPDQLAALLGL